MAQLCCIIIIYFMLSQNSSITLPYDTDDDFDVSYEEVNNQYEFLNHQYQQQRYKNINRSHSRGDRMSDKKRRITQIPPKDLWVVISHCRAFWDNNKHLYHWRRKLKALYAKASKPLHYINSVNIDSLTRWKRIYWEKKEGWKKLNDWYQAEGKCNKLTSKIMRFYENPSKFGAFPVFERTLVASRQVAAGGCAWRSVPWLLRTARGIRASPFYYRLLEPFMDPKERNKWKKIKCSEGYIRRISVCIYLNKSVKFHPLIYFLH